jgi:hypothetical protein
MADDVTEDFQRFQLHGISYSIGKTNSKRNDD